MAFLGEAVGPKKGSAKPKIIGGTTNTPSSGASVGPPPKVTVQTGADWRKALEGDVRYTSGLTGLQSSKDLANTSRRNAIRAALMRYGVKDMDPNTPGTQVDFDPHTPGIQGDQYGDVDQGFLNTAGANPEGIFARLKAAFTDNLQSSRNSMEDRGMIDSGFRVSGDQFQGKQYASQDFDAALDLGGLISGAVGGYQGAERDYLTGKGKLTTEVGNELQNDPAFAATTDAALIPGNPYGQPVYKSADGRLWNQDGTPFVPGPKAPAPAGNVWGLMPGEGTF